MCSGWRGAVESSTATVPSRVSCLSTGTQLAAHPPSTPLFQRICGGRQQHRAAGAAVSSNRLDLCPPSPSAPHPTLACPTARGARRMLRAPPQAATARLGTQSPRPPPGVRTRARPRSNAKTCCIALCTPAQSSSPKHFLHTSHSLWALILRCLRGSPTAAPQQRRREAAAASPFVSGSWVEHPHALAAAFRAGGPLAGRRGRSAGRYGAQAPARGAHRAVTIVQEAALRLQVSGAARNAAAAAQRARRERASARKALSFGGSTLPRHRAHSRSGLRRWARTLARRGARRRWARSDRPHAALAQPARLPAPLTTCRTRRAPATCASTTRRPAARTARYSSVRG
jgi:hypothetical protein